MFPSQTAALVSFALNYLSANWDDAISDFSKAELSERFGGCPSPEKVSALAATFDLTPAIEALEGFHQDWQLLANDAWSINQEGIDLAIDNAQRAYRSLTGCDPSPLEM